MHQLSLTSLGAWYFWPRFLFLLPVGVLAATRCLYSAPPSICLSSCVGSCPAQNTGIRSLRPSGRGRTTRTAGWPSMAPGAAGWQCMVEQESAGVTCLRSKPCSSLRLCSQDGVTGRKARSFRTQQCNQQYYCSAHGAAPHYSQINCHHKGVPRPLIRS